MDPITTAIIAALSAGAISGLTDTSKTAITETYNHLKTLLATKFGKKSEVVQALEHLEAKPDSVNRQGMVQEELASVHAEADQELLAAAQHLSTLIQPQQAATGKYVIQNTGPSSGQTIGEHNTITQQYGTPPTPHPEH